MRRKLTVVETKIIRRCWSKGEVPHCEIRSITFPRELGEPIVIRLTPRGAKESRRINREMAREEAKSRRMARSGKYGVDVEWLLFGPFCTVGEGRRRPVFS